ncbi:MAG: flippase [Bacteroidales bacterium]|nr:flippase [Clostridium sp.]MCM1203295.1 flippase [Bacteroidales bacterium]
MEQKSIKKNYIYNVAYQILTIITPLITAPYISRVLNADGIGLYSYVNAVVSVFTLFAGLGTSIYGQREISYTRKNLKLRSEVFYNVLFLRLFCSLCVSLLYLLYFIRVKENKIIFLIVGINIIAGAFDITWFFQGMEEFGMIVLRNTIIKVINIIVIFSFVNKKEDLHIYIGSIVLLTFLGNLSLWTYLPKFVNRVELKAVRPFKDMATVISLFVPTIAVQIYVVLDKAMLGFLAGDVFQNGYYEQAMKISRMTVTIVTALGTVMTPRIGNYFENKRADLILEYMYRSFRFVFMLAIPMCLGIFAVSDNFVPWFFGPGYDEVVPLLKISSFLIIIVGVNNVMGIQYLIPTKRQNIYSKAVVTGAGVNLCLNFIMIPQFGAMGAMISSVIAEISVSLVQILFIKSEYSVKTIMKQSCGYFFAGVTMFLVINFEKCFFKSSMLNTVIIVCTGIAVYAAVLYIIRDDFFIGNIKRLLKK